jgi:hypothetical protein
METRQNRIHHRATKAGFTTENTENTEMKEEREEEDSRKRFREATFNFFLRGLRDLRGEYVFPNRIPSATYSLPLRGESCLCR